MKNKLLLNCLFLTLFLAINPVAFSKEHNNQACKFLKEVTAERIVTKADLITRLDKTFPGLDIKTSALAQQIKDVQITTLVYNTTGVDGKPTVASGVVAMATDTKEYDHLLSIQHYTIDMEEAPSLSIFYHELAPVVKNHVVVAADYLGYGVSQTPNRQHPYLHNESTGRVCADMIEAAREYLASKSIKQTSDQIDLMGFSQGANSTIATVYELEKRGQGAQIRDVYAGGGSYDLISTMNSFAESGTGASESGTGSSYPRMGYLPYIIRGLSYGEQITLDETKIYAPSLISSGLINIFNTEPLSMWHKKLGTDIKQLMHPDFFAGQTTPPFNGNTEILKLLDALKKNSLVERKAPQTAIKLYHSKQDDFVPYLNAESAATKWPNATLTELSSIGHIGSGAEFILRFMGLWK